MTSIIIKEVPIEDVLDVNSKIIEFTEPTPIDKNYFEKRYTGKEKLILLAHVDNQPAGYLVGYDEYNDGSFYCWMAGVDPKFRKMGVLTSLMDYENTWAKEKGYNKIKIKTRNYRREMISFLVKHDFLFTKVEEQPSAEENRIYLEKSL
jgi:ribosomal protein S18 acetylase RimI-like enzyme